jgi:hypothetical protein
VLTGASLIYSIWRGNAHVATVEVRPHWKQNGEPAIAQLRGPENDDVGDDISHAVTQWLSRQGRYPFAETGPLARMPFNGKRWARLWVPFQDAKENRKLAIQPLQSHRALDELSRYA